MVFAPNDVSNLRFFKQGRTLLAVVDGWILLGNSYPARKYHGTICEISAGDQYLIGSSDYGLFVIRVSNWSATSAVPSESVSQMAVLSNGHVLFFGKQGVKQYYMRNRWTSPLSDPNAGWMPGSTTLVKGSKSHQ